jgi:hypothetical protein
MCQPNTLNQHIRQIKFRITHYPGNQLAIEAVGEVKAEVTNSPGSHRRIWKPIMF